MEECPTRGSMVPLQQVCRQGCRHAAWKAALRGSGRRARQTAGRGDGGPAALGPRPRGYFLGRGTAPSKVMEECPTRGGMVRLQQVCRQGCRHAAWKAALRGSGRRVRQTAGRGDGGPATLGPRPRGYFFGRGTAPSKVMEECPTRGSMVRLQQVCRQGCRHAAWKAALRRAALRSRHGWSQERKASGLERRRSRDRHTRLMRRGAGVVRTYAVGTKVVSDKTFRPAPVEFVDSCYAVSA